MKIALAVIAGLGLFIIGIRLMGDYLGQMTGRRMKQLVSRAVRGQRSAGSLGLLLGAVMQSSNAVIFMLANLVRAGVLDVHKAQPVINFANLGTAAVVLLASVSLHGLAMVLIGLIGIAYHRNLHEDARWRPVTGALLGVGLLFLGLDFLKGGATALKHAEWLQEMTAGADKSILLEFGLGFLVTLVVQSSSVITIVAMTVASTGLIDVWQGANVVLGAILGSGVTALMLGYNLQGRARQLVVYQFILKAAGVIAGAVLLLIEGLTGVPLLIGLLSHLGVPTTSQIAVLYLVVHGLSDLAVHPLHHHVNHWLEHLAPESETERLARPRFLNEDSLAEPETALLLLEREQLQLLAALPDYINGLRDDSAPPGMSVQARHAASQRLVAECDEFITALADRHRSRETLEATTLQRNRIELVRSLNETLWDFQREAGALQGVETIHSLLHAILESSHLLLTNLIDAATARNPDDIQDLRAMTHDRSDLMDGIRRRTISACADLPNATQQSIFAATMYFERLVWLLRRYVLIIDADNPPSPALKETDHGNPDHQH